MVIRNPSLKGCPISTSARAWLSRVSPAPGPSSCSCTVTHHPGACSPTSLRTSRTKAGSVMHPSYGRYAVFPTPLRVSTLSGAQRARALFPSTQVLLWVPHIEARSQAGSTLPSDLGPEGNVAMWLEAEEHLEQLCEVHEENPNEAVQAALVDACNRCIEERRRAQDLLLLRKRWSERRIGGVTEPESPIRKDRPAE